MKNLFFTILFSLFPLLGFMQVNIDAKDIIAKLNKGEAAHYENVTVSGDLDFRLIEDREKEKDIEVIFKESVTYKYHVNAPLKFTNCTFSGKVIGYYHDEDEKELHIALFHEDVLFSNCTFKDDFLVKYSKFDKAASFQKNTFEEVALFKYAEL